MNRVIQFFRTELSGHLSLLLSPKRHNQLLTSRRAHMILSRTRLISALFAALTPLWIVTDAFMFPWPVWVQLASGRLVCSVFFLALVLLTPQIASIRKAYRNLAIFFVIAALFFAYAYVLLDHQDQANFSHAFTAGYGFLPFVLVAGLSIFPLTALEGLVFSIPLLVMHQALLPMTSPDNPLMLFASFWMLLLMAVVAILSSMSQLAFVSGFVNQSTRDHLTGCYTRLCGAELLEAQFIISCRSKIPMCIAFLDIDDFKKINDQFGHDVGDTVLQEMIRKAKEALRISDMIIRWGGEEFLLLLPNTTPSNAVLALQRLMNGGLGMRPDGKPITASIGLAGLPDDEAQDWKESVKAADERMYIAKRTGKNRIICALNLPPPAPAADNELCTEHP